MVPTLILALLLTRLPKTKTLSDFGCLICESKKLSKQIDFFPKNLIVALCIFVSLRNIKKIYKILGCLGGLIS